MSNVGAPTVGDQPGFSIDTSLGTQIARYDLIQVSENTTTGNLNSVGLCGTGATGRSLACGVAFRAWPYVPQIFAPSGRPSTDITTLDTTKKKRLAMRQEGYTWMKVYIPQSGSTVTISPGMRLYPSYQQPGGVEPRAATTLTAAYNSATIIAEEAVDQNCVARAYSMIIIPPSGASWGGLPSLGAGTPTATLTADTTTATWGFVYARLGKG